MKRFKALSSLLGGVALGGALAPAQAQSGVQMYGLLDVGMDRVSNVGGSKLTAQNTGILAPNLIGIKGAEDLGGGLKASFNLESQFAMDDGTTVGNLFGRHAEVALSGALGSISGGVLNDFMFTSLGRKRYGPMMPYVELRFLRQGPFSTLGPSGSFDFDRVAAATRIANAVRYDSPNLNGFNFGALYGAGEQAGADALNRTLSAGADYAYGPWTVMAAATSVRYAAINNGRDGIDNWGIGGRRDFDGGAAWDVLYTNTKNTFTGGKIDVLETGYLMPLTARTGLMTQYTHMKGNDIVGGATAHQLNMGLHYVLSKRSRLYTSVAVQKVSGGDGSAKAQLILAGGTSSNQNQNIVRVGMFHAF